VKQKTQKNFLNISDPIQKFIKPLILFVGLLGAAYFLLPFKNIIDVVVIVVMSGIFSCGFYYLNRASEKTKV
jgi:uncharacterized membrane protein YjjP (DUF1212 family)